MALLAIARASVDVRPRGYRPYRIRINRADSLELGLLPGIGDGTARRILRSRQLHGAFEASADLERVEGVGPSVRRRLARHAGIE